MLYIPSRNLAGYHGTNDTGVFNLSQLGQGNRPLPDWARGLADGGYPERLPLIIPWNRNEFEGNEERREMNRWHRFYRSSAERSVRRIKVFRCLSSTWRHLKYFQGVVSYTVGCIANIKLQFEREIRENPQPDVDDDLFQMEEEEMDQLEEEEMDL